MVNEFSDTLLSSEIATAPSFIDKLDRLLSRLPRDVRWSEQALDYTRTCHEHERLDGRHSHAFYKSTNAVYSPNNWRVTEETVRHVLINLIGHCVNNPARLMLHEYEA